jgi:hypothetical protein
MKWATLAIVACLLLAVASATTNYQASAGTSGTSGGSKSDKTSGSTAKVVWKQTKMNCKLILFFSS